MYIKAYAKCFVRKKKLRKKNIFSYILVCEYCPLDMASFIQTQNQMTEYEKMCNKNSFKVIPEPTISHMCKDSKIEWHCDQCQQWNDVALAPVVFLLPTNFDLITVRSCKNCTTTSFHVTHGRCCACDQVVAFK
jgi:hypothetical protein